MKAQIKQQIEQEALRRFPEPEIEVQSISIQFEQRKIREANRNNFISICEWYHNNIKESVNEKKYSVNDLRVAFEAGEDNYDFDEWYKGQTGFSASNQEKNNKTYCDCEVGKCEGGKQDRCAFIHAKPNQEKNEMNEYEYEMYFESHEDDNVKIDGWYPISTDRINDKDKIPQYLENGILRRINPSKEK